MYSPLMPAMLDYRMRPNPSVVKKGMSPKFGQQLQPPAPSYAPMQPIHPALMQAMSGQGPGY